MSTSDQARPHLDPLRKLVVIAHMFGLAGTRSELVRLLAEAERTTAAQDGCLSYLVASGVVDRNHYIVVEEWRDQAALEAHYASIAFERFQYALHGLLARPSEVTIHSVVETHRPLAPALPDPRDVD
jgi:quinol monooxygenase YgiN